MCVLTPCLSVLRNPMVAALWCKSLAAEVAQVIAQAGAKLGQVPLDDLVYYVVELGAQVLLPKDNTRIAFETPNRD